MPAGELDRMLGSGWESRLLVDSPAPGYRLYKNLGLPVRIQDGTVAELVVTQIPFAQ